ncbi:mechanosensitive ion channel family protein [Avrilella dinanensis]|uniref:Mechanosensing system component YbdG n=2 Tax=Avrilella dinanensis TaxID=2008672 RepID=A0A2M9R2P4_9FLAO|nr:mechanosensitive ion channel domain-containing protein [Avrilella dinanensis]PJR03013.1 mechanosensitive ion channel protein MscS [Avrilella dinanensis]
MDTLNLYNYSFEKLQALNLSDNTLHFLNTAIWVVILILAFLIIHWVTNKLIINKVVKFILNTKNQIDDFLIKNKTLNHIGSYIPLIVLKIFIPIVFKPFPNTAEVLATIINILMLLAFLRIVHSGFKTAKDVLALKPAFKDKPLNSYLQVIDIVLYFIGGSFIFSIITGTDPKSFFISLGTASAILMLVFKDTILGLVASIQVSTNDSVRVGDWIEMPKHGADGDVIEINLNNIKVQNFDKTITTIPTYLLLSEAFKNWRGMQDAGGRRVKRALNVKISSIRFMTDEEINGLYKIEILKEFIDQRKTEIQQYNEVNQIDVNMPVNGRRMTNVGLFRAYITQYLRHNPNIHSGMTLMVRQLQPTEKGLPLELYMFTNSTVWGEYESIISNIFDHLFAAVKFFDLEIFESPASDDIRQVVNQKP